MLFPQRAHLNISVWIDLVHGISGLSTSLSVEVVALYKETVVTEASYPDITLTTEVQLDTLADVQPAHHITRIHSVVIIWI